MKNVTTAEHSAQTLFAELVGRLETAGVVPARDDAAHLWRALVGDLPFGIDRPVSAALGANLATAGARRARGEPLAYVLGRMPFRFLELSVDPRVLIPRPETEGLVQCVLDRFSGHLGGRVLEIGVGSGCISLALATEGEFDHIVGVDVSGPALEVAGANLRAVGATNVSFLAGFGAEALTAQGAFDLVVSNPPYLTEAEGAALDESVRGYEPDIALVSDADGLAATRMVCRAARKHLVPRGLLAIEIDSRRPAESAAFAVESGFENVEVQEDLFGRPRYLLARQPGRVL